MKLIYPQGATPINDISGLKLTWVRTQSDLNKVEAENIASAVGKYLTRPIRAPQDWFNLFFLQEVHLAMFGEVWDWAGSFRTRQLSIGVPYYQIRNELAQFCDDVQFWCDKGCELTFLEQAAKIHHRLVFIHPFLNGNGRFSRLVADRYLKFWDLPFPRWPVDIGNDGQKRRWYIESLKEADRGDYEPLIEFMIDCGSYDPVLGVLLGNSFYRKHFKGQRLILLVKAYLRRGCDVNEEADDGHRPLDIALKHGLLDVSRLLLEYGAVM
ncbi:mobile mystery protein B [Simkania negevensis]|uniref:Mobile mystery protein B n=1 Tax=Simkania negevensis TaxID=83561 RepID=A0ABS3ASV3_9BACT|nr:mobile mystery protein B [Simkania negevensis]